MAKKIFVGFYVVIFVMSLIFGFTLRSYAAPAKCSSAITTEEFRRAAGHDLEQLGKMGIHTSIRSSDEVVEMRFHCDKKTNENYSLDAGETSLLVDGSAAFINVRSKQVTICGVEDWTREFGVYHRDLSEAFSKYDF